VFLRSAGITAFIRPAQTLIGDTLSFGGDRKPRIRRRSHPREPLHHWAFLQTVHSATIEHLSSTLKPGGHAVAGLSEMRLWELLVGAGRGVRNDNGEPLAIRRYSDHLKLAP
jgi:hypothetical protein